MVSRSLKNTLSLSLRLAALLMLVVIWGCDQAQNGSLLPTGNGMEMSLDTATSTVAPLAAPMGRGAIVGIAPPASVVEGATESDTEIRMFRERGCFLLPQDVAVDITQPGTYYDPNGVLASPLTPGVIPTGTRVNVYFLHQDSVSNNLINLGGALKFDEVILGVIVQSTTLDNSDWLGAPATTYPTGLDPNRGQEPFDQPIPPAGFDDHLRLDPGMQKLRIRWETTLHPDQIRVITACEEFCGDLECIPPDGGGAWQLNAQLSHEDHSDTSFTLEGSLTVMLPNGSTVVIGGLTGRMVTDDSLQVQFTMRGSDPEVGQAQVRFRGQGTKDPTTGDIMGRGRISLQFQVEGQPPQRDISDALFNFDVECLP